MANRTNKDTTARGKRASRQERAAREQQRKVLGWGVLALAALVVIGFLIWNGITTASTRGEQVTVGSSEHVPTGSDLTGKFPTNPPAGGVHYPETYDAGFYSEEQAGTLPTPHEGYLVHNLEHGYIIFWYNCAAGPNIDCDELKDGIQQVMGEFNNRKVIGFPWPSQEAPLVLTSWTRILRLPGIDLDAMRAFTRANMNKSPEPNAE